MKCREVQEILTEEIQLAESREVREHLESCQECRDLHRELLSLQQLSGELKGQAKAPRLFAERVCSRASSRRSRATYLTLAATAAGVVLFTFGMVNLGGLSAEGNLTLKSQATEGGERIQKIDGEDRTAVASQEEQPDVFYLGDEEWGSQRTKGSQIGREDGVPLMIPKSSSSGYVLELPATIEVRQTQADNEFYLENVSH